MNYDNIARRRQRWRHIVYCVLISCLTLHVIHHLIFGHVKESMETYRGRRLLEYENIEEENYVYQTNYSDDEKVQLDFLSNWHLNEPSSNSSQCRVPSVDAFPADLFSDEQRKKGAIIVHLVVAMYLCIAIGIAADYYFIPSLEVICYIMNIQEDVGGATLMCIGSSAPDIFAAICGVLFTDGDVGIGTIMGSSIFNVLFVVGFCGIMAYEVLMLSWYPFIRDMLWYMISVVILVAVIFDSWVYWQEALIMVIFYFLYAVFLWQNKRVEKYVYKVIGDTESYSKRFDTVDMKYSLTNNGEKKVDDDEASKSSEENESDYCSYPQDPPVNIFTCPDDSIILIISWMVTLPIKVVFFLTIPDLRRQSCQKFVAFTFLNGMIWIGVLTYVLLWMVTTIGSTLNIPDSVMGITFVALGTSVPDWFCSVFVARRGKADMAISQSVASNTFGILFGLGTPWLIKTLVKGHKDVRIESVGMLISCFINIFIATVVIIVFKWRKFQLGRKLGFVMIGGYVIYLAISIIMEVKLFIDNRLPPCIDNR